MLGEAARDEAGKAVLAEATRSKTSKVALDEIACGEASEAALIKIHVQIGHGPSRGDVSKAMVV